MSVCMYALSAFQWAQGGNEVFINVKFSHKIDAPATLNVEPTKVSLGLFSPFDPPFFILLFA